jgi:hypothetical protein
MYGMRGERRGEEERGEERRREEGKADGGELVVYVVVWWSGLRMAGKAVGTVQ